MNSDIRVSVSFKGNRKRLKLKMILGDNSTDYLLDLWLTAAMERPTGDFTGLDEIDIAIMAGWRGDPHQFTSALLQVGLLDRDESGNYSLHDWKEHNGYACGAPERSEAARKAVQARWVKQKQAEGNTETYVEQYASYDSVLPDVSNRNTPSPSPSPSPIENLSPSSDDTGMADGPLVEDLPTTTIPATARSRPRKHPPSFHRWFSDWFIWSFSELTGRKYVYTKADAGIIAGLLGSLTPQELVSRATCYLLLSDGERFPRGSPDLKGLAGMVNRIAGMDTDAADLRAVSLGILPEPGVAYNRFTPWKPDNQEPPNLKAA